LEAGVTGKILVVDDDPHILYLLRIILKTEGFVVVTCQDETQVLSYLAKEKFNLVILDLIFSKISGWDICKSIRSNPATEKVPILIMSSLPFKEKERALVRELEIYDYITKPFEPIHLLGKVKSLFQVPPPLRHLVKEIPMAEEVHRGTIIRKVETLVIGGGIAGLSAAEAAARNGAEVMLLGLWPFLADELLVFNTLVWFPKTPEEQEEKFFQLLKKNKALRHFPTQNAFSVDPEGARKAAHQLLTELRIPFMLNATLLDVIREGAVLKGVVVDGENGLEQIQTQAIIDATIDGKILNLAEIPGTDEKFQPCINLLLGGIKEKANPETLLENTLYPLPSGREAVLLNIPLQEPWRDFFYEGLDTIVKQVREKVAGCEKAYVLRRPLEVLFAKKRFARESYPLYGGMIPKTFERILICGYPLLEANDSLHAFRLLYSQGKIAGTVAGVALAYAQSFREIEGEKIREALKA
jgi:CheY-like chemotaxis protein